MFEGNSMEGTSLECSERDDSVVMEIENASSVKNSRSCVRRNQVQSEDEDSVSEEEEMHLKPSAVTQQDEACSQGDSEDGDDKIEVYFVSF